MALAPPRSLSPSKVATYKECALAFRLAVIDQVAERPSVDAARGTIVHRALELLMWEEEPPARTLDSALDKLVRATTEVLDGEEYEPLGLDLDARAALFSECEDLVRNYFRLEDPRRVRVMGTELRLATELNGMHLSGIIDRLELDDAGELVITDYKTGFAPAPKRELRRMDGVHFYALLCQRVLGRRPAWVQLLHLREPLAISSRPSAQSIRAMEQKLFAIWDAVLRACADEDFRPRPGRLCPFCSYHELCPAMGGDLARLTPAGAA
jgi:putative RecB family exonuclease